MEATLIVNPDGTYSQRTTTTITGSLANIPVALEYNALTDDEALPIKQISTKGVIKVVAIEDTATVAAAAASPLSSVVPAGKKWTILEWTYYALAPTGAASGTHTMNIYIGTANLNLGKVTNDYNKRVQYQNSQFYDSNAGTYITTAVPDDKTAQFNLLRKTELQNGVNISFNYTNNTNVEQAQARKAWLLVLEEDLSV